MHKTHVYFVPGLAANTSIFSKIRLPEEQFVMHLMEWKIPLSQETLQDYAKRMTLEITEKQIVLIGVSFGGVMVQEMAQFLDLKKLIIISSVKSNEEIPSRLKFLKKTKAYKLFPSSLMSHLEILNKFSFPHNIKHRLDLYEKYMSVRDKKYLDWSIEQMLLWKRTNPDDKVIHIHGENDEVFPIKNISNAIKIPGGTHIMILNKYKILNELLPQIILEEYKI